MHYMVRMASIFSRTATYGGIQSGEADALSEFQRVFLMAGQVGMVVTI